MIKLILMYLGVFIALLVISMLALKIKRLVWSSSNNIINTSTGLYTFDIKKRR